MNLEITRDINHPLALSYDDFPSPIKISSLLKYYLDFKKPVSRYLIKLLS